MLYFVEIDNRKYKIEIAQKGDKWESIVDGRPLELISGKIEGNRVVSFILDGKYYQIEVVKNGDSYLCWSGSKLFKTSIMDEKSARFSHLVNNQLSSSKSETLQAPMPGLIVKVEIEPGQEVKKGQGLIIMEAMKMENELRAIHDCAIRQILIQPGQIVDKAQPLIIFK